MFTEIITTAANKPPGTEDDGHEFATTMYEQIKLVTHRMNVALYRNIDYTNNKIALHITCALFNGFTFWKIGKSASDQQEVLFAVFNFICKYPFTSSSSSLNMIADRVNSRCTRSYRSIAAAVCELIFPPAFRSSPC